MNEQPCGSLLPERPRCYLGRLTYLTCTGCSGYHVHPEPQEAHWAVWRELCGGTDTLTESESLPT